MNAALRRPALTLALWAATCALLVPRAPELQARLDVGARVDGSESAAVEQVLATRFRSAFTHTLLLVVRGAPAPDTPAGEELLRALLAELRGERGVTRTYSWLDTHDPALRGADGSGSLVVIGLDPEARRLDDVVPALRARARAFEARRPGLGLRFTGAPALNYDLRRASAEEVRRAERRALPLTLALLLLAFGSVVAAGLPLLLGALTIGLASGAAALLARVVPLNLSVVNAVSMLGLGLSIDYALLTVARFREGLDAGQTALDAARDCVRHVAHTLGLSGAALALGLAGLFAVPLNELRSVAVGGLLVVGFSVLLAATALPVLLQRLGARTDGGRPGRSRAAATRRAQERWRRWGTLVVAHPRGVLVLAGLPLLLLAAQALRLRTGLPQGDWLPPGIESGAALRDLAVMRRGGLVQEARLVIEWPEGTSALAREAWEATCALHARLAADPRVARVRWLGNVAGEGHDQLAFASLVPYAVKRVYVSDDAEAALLTVQPHDHVDPPAWAAFVRELRAAPPVLPGARLRVGGLPAHSVDYADAVAGGMPRIVTLVLGASLLALLFGFRSPVIALKAVLLNVLAVAAAFGAVVLAFQDGFGAALLDLPGPTGRVFPALPALVFCTVFGLSLDYEIFLVARLAEARRAGLDDRAGLIEALAHTGPLISRAAAVMVAVFGAFMLGHFLLIKMLGFALAVAVLLDATLVRLALGPALVLIAGRWNWWPAESSAAPCPAPRVPLEAGHEA
jgi:RND superfamily putative drug exporter